MAIQRGAAHLFTIIQSVFFVYAGVQVEQDQVHCYERS